MPSNKTVISSNNVITNDLNADKANITENVDELEKDSNKLENGIETNEEFLNNKQQQNQLTIHQIMRTRRKRTMVTR